MDPSVSIYLAQTSFAAVDCLLSLADGQETGLVLEVGLAGVVGGVEKSSVDVVAAAAVVPGVVYMLTEVLDIENSHRFPAAFEPGFGRTCDHVDRGLVR